MLLLLNDDAAGAAVDAARGFGRLLFRIGYESFLHKSAARVEAADCGARSVDLGCEQDLEGAVQGGIMNYTAMYREINL